MMAWIRGHLVWLLVISLLISACAFLLYSWLDTLVSLDYARQGETYQRRTVQQLQGLLRETGKKSSKTEVKQVALKLFGKESVKDRDNQILVGDIILEFKGDAFVDVKLLNED